MRFCKILILAGKDDRGIPFLCLVLFEPIANDLRFTYVGIRLVGLWVCSKKDVHPSSIKLVSGQ